jgi:nitrite reductase (NAD(P)H)
VEWYTSQDPSRFEFHLDEAVVSISPSTHTITTSSGRTVTYDICVLATGSEATMPAYVDHNVKGVFVYRNISDLNHLLEYSQVEGVNGHPVSTSETDCGYRSMTYGNTRQR